VKRLAVGRVSGWPAASSLFYIKIEAEQRGVGGRVDGRWRRAGEAELLTLLACKLHSGCGWSERSAWSIRGAATAWSRGEAGEAARMAGWEEQR
jgi:hypothetical protein